MTHASSVVGFIDFFLLVIALPQKKMCRRPLFPEDDSLQQAWRERAKKFSLTQSGFCSFVNIDKGNFSKV